MEESIIIGEFLLGSGSQDKVIVKSHKRKNGDEFYDIRAYTRYLSADGQWMPTGKGLELDSAGWHELKLILNKVS